MGKVKKLRGCPKLPLSLSKFIYIYNQQRDLPLSLIKLREAISFVMQELHLETDEVHFYFVSSKKMKALHKQIFQNPSTTDCITLPLDPLPKQQNSYHILGEAFICPKTAIEYCKSKSILPLQETYRYVIHCLLHFAGFTDDSASKRSRMRRKETVLLKKLMQ